MGGPPSSPTIADSRASADFKGHLREKEKKSEAEMLSESMAE
jgi:hypothetical protein